MPAPPLPKELAQAAVDAVREYGNVSAAARALGMPVNTLQNRYNRAAALGLTGYAPVQPGFEIKSIASKDGDAWIKQTRAPGEVYEIPAGHVIKGESALVDSDDRVIQRWIKTKQDTAVDNVLEAVRGLVDGVKKPAVLAPPAGNDPSTFTVIPLVDWHVGLMAWARETGENYDLKIARKTIMGAMHKLIALSPPSQKCIILGLGDMLHFDGYETITNRSGNFLDGDGRYPKVLRTAADMIRETIDLALQKFAQVTVHLIPGNHDPRATVALALGFSLLYEGQERIAFDDNPSALWWRREGKVLLGAAHGDKAKMKDLPLVMAHDCPQDWAKSTYRRIYTGHIHHERVIEEGGVVVTSMRSPVAKDAYHSFERYRSGRSVYSDTFNVDGSGVIGLQVNI